MSEDEVGPPPDEFGADRNEGAPPPPRYDPDHQLIGYLEEKEGQVHADRRR